MNEAARAEHRAFLNRYYGASRLFYDATRKHYLFGRDRALRDLAHDRTWHRLAEIGPGTGRNLTRLRKARPDTALGGIEACDAMLEHARARCPWAVLQHGFAEDASLGSLFGGPPDVVLFSYCLSMVGDRTAALVHARRSLAPGGRVVVVDFGDFGGLPRPVADAFRAYLRAFRVDPLDGDALAGAASVVHGPARYYVVATFSAARA
ncbi:MAG TPA: class I SAM-dependent methyltransferase [Polyangiaceae bacterium]